MLIATDSPILCYVTGRRALAPDPRAAAPPLIIIRRAIEVGVDLIQIREKDLPARELMQLARDAVAASYGSSTRILVNDRLDIALEARAAGVHLGGESLPVRAVAAWRDASAVAAAKHFLVGASCHSIPQAQFAERDRADYIVFGPVFATPSKASSRAPQGIERLREVCEQVRTPVLAIGGVNPENAAECFRAGAAGIAAIRMFQEANSTEELKRVVEQLHSLKRS